MGSEDDDDDQTFGVTRRIMLAAVGSLVGVVMLMIILHLYARYLLRRQERRRQAELYSLRTDRITTADEIRIIEPPKSGLDPLVIASLPMFTYTGQVDEPTECSVCLGNITEESMIRLLPNCNHVFHVQCIDTWLGSHTTCPICRTAAEPSVQPVNVESVDRVRATAPPIEENASQSATQVEKDGGPSGSGSGSGSGSRFGSFRWMLGRQRSSNRIQSFEDHETGSAQNLER
ncbi:Nudix hydrolase 15 [Hibiscus syriacus]|uniref:RING-type E3 ubiquitin transferase n=1 Tax=Hibiscus syriacus TaxID=106335 RepID=A0A6A3BY56_HIBSY|nr:E3 ubiquitin-protein ligase ATL41-like [Hibiscus syriacus]KAE8719909.1 Nudix hydrolase 15 [Hibiscus syriacus]